MRFGGSLNLPHARYRRPWKTPVAGDRLQHLPKLQHSPLPGEPVTPATFRTRPPNAEDFLDAARRRHVRDPGGPAPSSSTALGTHGADLVRQRGENALTQTAV